MKPLEGNFTQNALRHGVAGINVDGCRIASETLVQSSAGKGAPFGPGAYPIGEGRQYQSNGRWPANVILEESDEIKSKFPLVNKQAICKTDDKSGWQSEYVGGEIRRSVVRRLYLDSQNGGSASRFFKQVKP
jgi:hypothetical protein